MRPSSRCERLGRVPASGLRARLRAEEGSATLEFLTAGLLLLVPTVYLVIALAQLQAGAYATEGAARQAARVYVRADTVDDAAAAADRAVRVGLADYGVDARTAEVAVTCAPDPDDCLARGGSVTVRVAVTVALPLLPTAIDAATPTGVPMAASATQPVSRFRGAQG